MIKMDVLKWLHMLHTLQNNAWCIINKQMVVGKWGEGKLFSLFFGPVSFSCCVLWISDLGRIAPGVPALMLRLVLSNTRYFQPLWKSFLPIYAFYVIYTGSYMLRFSSVLIHLLFILLVFHISALSFCIASKAGYCSATGVSSSQLCFVL